MEQERIYSEKIVIFSRRLHKWIDCNYNTILSKCKEIAPDLNEVEDVDTDSMFVGDWDDYYQSFESSFDDTCIDDEYEVVREAVIRTFFEQFPECKDKSIIIVRS